MSFLKNANLLRRQAYINGAWTAADSGKNFPVNNPATGELLAEVADCGAAETARAIAAADAALPDWRAKTATQRAKILRRWNDLILENQADLGLLMTLEQGKPLAEARGEVVYGASFVEWFAEEGKRIYGDIIPPHAANLRVLVTKQPIGVCAA
ncbi:MAG: aldehyde dehydrogenase family protein, partial [Saprospiraceae bacterium]